jgi:hypothetical protein
MSAKMRCIYPKDPFYPSYGGSGIRMDERWLNSFETFYAEMGARPEGMSLDRIDSRGDYAPGNCRWANKYEQARNRSNVKLSMWAARVIRILRGEGVSAQVVADSFGIARSYVWSICQGHRWAHDT